MMMLKDVIALSAKLCKQPIKAKLKYATCKNFVGEVIDGYDPQAIDFAMMSPISAKSLCKVQNYLLETYGYGLLIYDAYRPKRAVKHFMFWSTQEPKNDYELQRKAKHYPNVEKSKFFELGYVAEDSGHCYGNTVDLVLIDCKTGKKVPMGSCYDYMDVNSHVTATPEMIGKEAHENRKILSEAMVKFGFHTYDEEYWHFSHGGKEGREINSPMDLPITIQMKGLGV
ncbi:MAG: M15 family metallopeptidase [Legionella sp.]